MPTRPPVHKPVGMRSEAQRKAAFDLTRGTPEQRGYGADWRKCRKEVLRERRYCATPECGARTRLEVHHIVSVLLAPQRRLDKTNLRVLCNSCHSKVTALENKFGR